MWEWKLCDAHQRGHTQWRIVLSSSLLGSTFWKEDLGVSKSVHLIYHLRLLCSRTWPPLVLRSTFLQLFLTAVTFGGSCGCLILTAAASSLNKWPHRFFYWVSFQVQSLVNPCLIFGGYFLVFQATLMILIHDSWRKYILAKSYGQYRLNTEFRYVGDRGQTFHFLFMGRMWEERKHLVQEI